MPRHRPLPDRHCIVMVALWSALHAGQAQAAINLIDMSSESRFSSALYPTTVPQFDHQDIGNLNAWNAAGRTLDTTTLPVQGGSVFPGDAKESAWAHYEQSNVASQYRAYAEVSGYYLDAEPYNYARNEVTLRNRVMIEDNRPKGSTELAYIALAHTAHGFMVSEGLANNTVTYASEEMSWCTPSWTTVSCAQPYAPDGQCHFTQLGTGPSIIAGSFAGTAEVRSAGPGPYTDGVEMFATGDWADRSRKLYPGDPHGEGFELSALLQSGLVGIEPSVQMVLEVEFHGLYGVRTTANSGFRSHGLADFSGTSLTDWIAVDAAGNPIDGVTFTLLPPVASVPELGSAWLLLLGLAPVLLRQWMARRA